MATAVCTTFCNAFELAVGSTTPAVLDELTQATHQIVDEASRTEATKEMLFKMIGVIGGLPKTTPKAVFASILNGLPIDSRERDLEVQQLSLKTPAEIALGLKEKCSAIFAKNTAPAASPRGVEQPNNVKDKILQQLTKNNPVAVNFAKQINSELQFNSNRHLNQKGISSIENIARGVESLTNATALTAIDLQKKINDARGGMQTAQNIILDLAKYDDLNSKALKNQVQDLKDRLAAAVENLFERMSTLIASEKCEAAVTSLVEQGSEEAVNKLSATIDLYQETSASAIALVNVEKDIDTAVQKVETLGEKGDVVASQQAIAATSKALDQTSKALGTFAEIKAAYPKFSNPLLDKLRNAQKKLTEQTKKVVENPELKKALEENPQAKKIVDAETQTLAETAAQSQTAVENLDKPSTVQFSPMQQELNAIVNKTLADESTLDATLKKDISALAQRTIPLIKIINAGQLTDAESFSLARGMVDYIDILTFIYKKLEEGQKVSPEEMNKINDEMKKNGIHALAEFMRGEYYNHYRTLRTKIADRIGPDLLIDFEEKLADIHKMREQYNWQ